MAPWEKLRIFLILGVQKLYNTLIPRRPLPLPPPAPDYPELLDIRHKAQQRSDISDHLETLFREALDTRPQVLVELGVRGGESTFALERAARRCHAVLVSVDIDDASHLSTYADWHFIQSDDVRLGREFKDWCRSHHVPFPIDFLFIDTSHLFEHTRQEIEVWFPLLAPRAKVVLHDTHLKTFIFRKDGSLFIGWDNRRGVIRALEQYFQRPFDERHDFELTLPGWHIRHLAHSSGLTVLQRSAQSV